MFSLVRFLMDWEPKFKERVYVMLDSINDKHRTYRYHEEIGGQQHDFRDR